MISLSEDEIFQVDKSLWLQPSLQYAIFVFFLRMAIGAIAWKVDIHQVHFHFLGWARSILIFG